MNYNLGKIRSNTAYTINEIGELFDIDRKTVSRWIEEGLTLLDAKRSPRIVMGYALKAFLEGKRKARRTKLNSDEFHCFRCRRPVLAKNGSQIIMKTGKKIGKENKEQEILFAECNECGTKIWRFFKDAQSVYKTPLNPP